MLDKLKAAQIESNRSLRITESVSVPAIIIARWRMQHDSEMFGLELEEEEED